LAQKAGERGPGCEIADHARAASLKGRSFNELV
jgi:hypothetical protein